jgi:hypothetical protein
MCLEFKKSVPNILFSLVCFVIFITDPMVLLWTQMAYALRVNSDEMKLLYVSTLFCFHSPLISGLECRINITGKDNRMTMCYKIATRIVCVLSEQDTLVAAHAEQHQYITWLAQSISIPCLQILLGVSQKLMTPLQSHLCRMVEHIMVL